MDRATLEKLRRSLGERLAAMRARGLHDRESLAAYGEVLGRLIEVEKSLGQ